MCWRHKFVSRIWSGLPMRKRWRDETSLQILLKYRAHTFPKYRLKLLFRVSAHSSQILSKDSFQINCNSLLILLFCFSLQHTGCENSFEYWIPSSFSNFFQRNVAKSLSSLSCSGFFFSSLIEFRRLNIQVECTLITLFFPFSKFSGKNTLIKIIKS